MLLFQDRVGDVFNVNGLEEQIICCVSDGFLFCNFENYSLGTLFILHTKIYMRIITSISVEVLD